MNTPKENSVTEQKKNKKRYIFVQREGDDYTCIKIIDGKFENVVYKYDKVAFAKDENPDGKLPMRFGYDIIVNPDKADIDSQEFIDFIGDILMEQLEKQVKDGRAVFDK